MIQSAVHSGNLSWTTTFWSLREVVSCLRPLVFIAEGLLVFFKRSGSNQDTRTKWFVSSYHPHHPPIPHTHSMPPPPPPPAGYSRSNYSVVLSPRTIPPSPTQYAPPPPPHGAYMNAICYREMQYTPPPPLRPSHMLNPW